MHDAAGLPVERNLLQARVNKEETMSRRSHSVSWLGSIVAIAMALGLFGGYAAPLAAQDSPPATKGDLAAENWSWPVYQDHDGKITYTMYDPIDKSEITKQWNVCVSFPHLKDPYWLGADYGIVHEIERDGAKMQLFEAGGYTELATQLSQLDDCVAQGAQAIIIGAISFDGLNAKVEEIRAKGIPVIDFVNGISSPEVSAHALVSFYDMGVAAGAYLKDRVGSESANVAFFPGPQGAGWTDTAYQGFLDTTKDTGIKVIDTKWGDTGRDIQLKLIEDVLQAHDDIDYIVGNAQAAVSAVQAVREAGREDEIKVLAFHQNPPVYDGVAAGDIIASPNDHTVVQGRMAVDMAIRLLEGQTLPATRSGPVITVMTPENLATEFVWESTFAPKDFKPVFTV